MNPSLAETLQYKNIHVLHRYQKDFPNSTLSSEDVFTELLKYLWLIAKHNQDKQENPHDPSLNFTCLIHEEMIEIDDMWHTFLLFTKDYHDFCKQYFQGTFIHHYPLINTDKAIYSANYTQELDCYLSYIYDHLGAETLIKWFRADLEN